MQRWNVVCHVGVTRRSLPRKPRGHALALAAVQPQMLCHVKTHITSFGPECLFGTTQTEQVGQAQATTRFVGWAASRAQLYFGTRFVASAIESEPNDRKTRMKVDTIHTSSASLRYLPNSTFSKHEGLKQTYLFCECKTREIRTDFLGHGFESTRHSTCPFKPCLCCIASRSIRYILERGTNFLKAALVEERAITSSSPYKS